MYKSIILNGLGIGVNAPPFMLLDVKHLKMILDTIFFSNFFLYILYHIWNKNQVTSLNKI